MTVRPTDLAGEVTHLAHVRLIDPEAGTEREGHLSIGRDGTIAAIAHDGAPPPGAHDCGGLRLAPGIVDIGVKVGEPGERHKESFASAGRAAARGGVTTMVTRPDTTPAIDTPDRKSTRLNSSHYS